jgi:DNA gyrase subunit B
LIQEKFYKRKVTVIANGEVMEGSGFAPFQFEMMKTIVPADNSANPDIKVYITFDIDKTTLGPKQIGGSLNGLDCGAGIHIQYAESCFETALKNEYKIKHRMLTPGLRMFVLFLADDVQYSSQTKERCKSITKVKITDFNDLTREFQKIFRANPEYWESHVEVLEKLAESFKNLTASEKAEKLQVGNSVSAAYKLKNELGSKLVDATAGSSERWDTELFICEGDSAKGSLVKGRKSPKFHAILPVRGRVLNVDGMSVDQMLENKEFYTIFRSIGVGLDVNYVGSDCSDPVEAFEKIKKSSRYGKIIISTDADADGEAIANGLCYAISRFARFLIDFGMVYLIESPFFRDYQGKYYFPSDPVVPGTEFPVGMDTSKPFKRYKGLGGLSCDEVYDAFYNPATRRLIQVTPDNLDYANALVEQIQVRKNLLIQRGIITNPYGL